MRPPESSGCCLRISILVLCLHGLFAATQSEIPTGVKQQYITKCRSFQTVVSHCEISLSGFQSLPSWKAQWEKHFATTQAAGIASVLVTELLSGCTWGDWRPFGATRNSEFPWCDWYDCAQSWELCDDPAASNACPDKAGSSRLFRGEVAPGCFGEVLRELGKADRWGTEAGSRREVWKCQLWGCFWATDKDKSRHCYFLRMDKEPGYR